MGLLAIRSHVDTTDDRAARRRGPARGPRAWSRPTSTCSSSPSRRTASSARRTASTTSPAPSTWASTSSAASPTSSARWRRAPRSVRTLAALAAERGLMLDLHCDETDDPLSRHIETLAAETLPPRPRRPQRRLAPHLDALDGQLLRLEAPAADRRGRRRRDPEPAHQHHPPGPPRHLPQAPRPHPGQGDARPRHHRRLGPGLRARPLVLARHRRHARRRLHGPPRRPDDQPRRHARLLRHGDGGQRPHPEPRRTTASARAPAPASSSSTPPTRSRPSACRAGRRVVVSRGRVVAERPRTRPRLALPGRPAETDRRLR